MATHRAPAETRAAVIAAVRDGLRPLKAERPLGLSEWASRHFELDEESSHKRGLWEPWPFQRGWMDAMSHDDIEEVDVEKAKRVGYTKSIVACCEYNAAHRRRKLAVWQPTDDDRDSFVKSEIQPSFDVCRSLDPVRRSGVDHDTMKFKRFRGSVQHYLGAKAARSFRRITVAVSILDEVDAMDQVVEKTIDPVTGARGRLEGAPFPKLIIGTTPRVKGMSHVRRRSEQAQARMQFQVTCPLCGVEHPLMWGGKDVAHGFKWDGSDPKTAPDTVRHVCPHCRGAITQADYLRVWDGQWVSTCGRWRYDHHAEQWLGSDGQPTSPPRHVAFVNAWTAYSPQRTWPDIVREFLEARIAQKRGDSGPMMGFVNETLAEVWEEEFEATDSTVLIDRAGRDIDIPLCTVPAGACRLVMGIDTQADRWEAVTWAVGRGAEMWPIDYRIIYGNPAEQAEWAAKLLPIVGLSYDHVHGARMPVDAVAIDTQGSNWTHQAYNFVRDHPHLPLYATKGEGILGAPIKMPPSKVDVNARGRVIKRGLKLWRICTDTAKDLLHGCLEKVGKPGRGYVHLNRHLPRAFFEHLSAEQRVPVRTVRGLEHRWVCPSGHRNEALDCTVMCLFLIEVLQLRSQPDSYWERLESLLVPDLFSLPAPAAVAAAHPIAPAQVDDPSSLPAPLVDRQSIDRPAKRADRVARPLPPAPRGGVAVSPGWSSRI